jgi:glutathione S-transferase
MITVYGFSRLGDRVVGLTRDLRVLWAVEELGLPYRVQGLDFQKDLDTDEYRKRSDFAQVPSIDDDGYVLAESGAILLYLAEKAGAITAADVRRRYDVTRWCIAALSTIEPAVIVVNALALSKASDVGSKHQLAQMTRLTEMRLTALDHRLGEHDYIVDGTFTVADILLVTVLRMLKGLGIVEQFADVRAYVDRCEKRPAWTKVLDAYEDRLHAPRGSARRGIPERLSAG